MSPQVYAKRISAIKLADTLNKIEVLIEQRNVARKAKNRAEADRIRDELKAQGITAHGVKWHRA